MRTLLLAAALFAIGIPAPGITHEPADDAKNSPVGNWRKTDDRTSVVITLSITADKLHLAIGPSQVEADYALTKDGLLYAVITKTSGLLQTSNPKPPVEDDTFSFRFRADADELRVHGVRGVGADVLLPMGGRYKKVPDGEIPATPLRQRKSGQTFKK